MYTKYFLVVVMNFIMGQMSARSIQDGRIINRTLEIYIIVCIQSSQIIRNL